MLRLLVLQVLPGASALVLCVNVERAATLQRHLCTQLPPSPGCVSAMSEGRSWANWGKMDLRAGISTGGWEMDRSF